MKDFYAILGIERSATQAQVQAAYRELAKGLHPDVNPHAAGMMALVNEAYETLGDAKKRAAYDRSAKVKTMAPVSTIPGTIDLTKLAQAFIPANIYDAAGPALERLIRERGVTPEAASVEQSLESFGVLKPKRKKSA